MPALCSHGWRAMLLALSVGLLATRSFSDVDRWDNGQPIPGTAGITLGPGVDLSSLSLQFANVSGVDVTAADFSGSDLTSADFMAATVVNADLSNANLTNANLTNANLSNANFFAATLSNATLTGATIQGADFAGATDLVFLQVSSTQSYQQKNLAGISLANVDVTNWDFTGQNLSGAAFAQATLTGANFSGANILGADFSSTTSTGFVYAQLVSTQSFQQKNLAGLGFGGDDLSGWDLSNQNLSGADLTFATLTSTNLSNANLTNASLFFASLTNTNFSGAIVQGTNFGFSTTLTFGQLASTQSYQQKNLAGIGLGGNDLTGWDLSHQNLTNADLDSTLLTNANLSNADLLNADLTNATLSNANLTLADLRGVTGFIADPTATLAGTVFPDGTVQSLQLASGQSRLFRASPIAIDVQQSLMLAGSRDNWLSTLDLTTNHFIVESTASAKAATLATLQNEVAYGSTHATGILSSALPARTALAVVDNAALATPFTTFGGTAVDAESILIAPELLGDSNLDGKVDLNDLNTVLNNLGTTNANWTSGNFDNATTIDLTDLNDVLNNLGTSFVNGNAVQPAIPTPEPASVAILCGGLVFLAARRRASKPSTSPAFSTIPSV